MKPISSIQRPSTSPFSFEFFPPKTDEGQKQLLSNASDLKPFHPRFFSITYGANGSTQQRSLNIIKQLQAMGLEAVPHLTCVGSTSKDIDNIADQYWQNGVRRIVALRGDAQQSESGDYIAIKGGYDFAVDLVAGLKSIHDFEIYVAAYPEVHPQAISAEHDLINLKNKMDAGATAAITQFFFNNDNFLRFRDKATKLGIDKPIIPGILPVVDFITLQRFAASCGATIPKKMFNTFDGLEDKQETRQLVAAHFLINQVLSLKAEGVEQFHFYTLNKSHLSVAACHTLLHECFDYSDDKVI